MARKDIKEITDKLEQGVKEVFESDRYKEYLTVMGRFTNYSFNNIMLILMQKPEATLVAGYKAWQNKFKRQVRKGEKGITILAPCPHKKEVEDDNGDVKVVRWTTFTTCKVFDVSQTDGEDLPTAPCEKLTASVDDYDGLMAKLAQVAPVEIRFEDISGSANGCFHNADDKYIAVQQGMSEAQTIKTAVHEIAHSLLHDNDNGEEKDADRLTREVQAESVAYTVCNALGLDTSEYSFGYVAGWSGGKDMKELTASMEVIRKTAAGILDALTD